MKQNDALQILEKYPTGKALMIAKREEITSVAPQYEPLVTVLELDWDEEFTNVGSSSNPQYYPNKGATNKIAEAAGIGFTPNCGTRKEGSWQNVRITQGAVHSDYKMEGEYKVIGWAQGYRIQPDGSKRYSSVCEYEFECTVRAALDFSTDAGKNPNAKNWQDRPKYETVEKKRKHFLELVKFAVQRAETGAQLKAIRELTGLPTAFKKSHYKKPLVISQTIENNKFKADIAEKLLSTPDGRHSVANAMFGNGMNIYGNQMQSPQIANTVMDDRTPLKKELPEKSEIFPETEGEYDDIEKSIFDSEEDRPELSPIDEGKLKLEEYLNDPVVNALERNVTGIKRIIDDPDATLEKVNETLEKIENWKSSKGGRS